MGYVLLTLILLLVFLTGWRLGNEFGLELRQIRAGRIEAEKTAACCCDRERRAKQERLAASLRRRQTWRRTHPT